MKSDERIRRRPTDERGVLSQASKLIGRVNGLRPSNPADTRRLFWVATEGLDVVNRANRAIACIVAGPHHDYDYIAQGLDDLAGLWGQLEDHS